MCDFNVQYSIEWGYTHPYARVAKITFTNNGTVIGILQIDESCIAHHVDLCFETEVCNVASYLNECENEDVFTLEFEKTKHHFEKVLPEIPLALVEFINNSGMYHYQCGLAHMIICPTNRTTINAGVFIDNHLCARFIVKFTPEFDRVIYDNIWYCENNIHVSLCQLLWNDIVGNDNESTPSYQSIMVKVGEYCDTNVLKRS